MRDPESPSVVVDVASIWSRLFPKTAGQATQRGIKAEESTHRFVRTRDILEGVNSISFDASGLFRQQLNRMGGQVGQDPQTDVETLALGLSKLSELGLTHQSDAFRIQGTVHDYMSKIAPKVGRTGLASSSTAVGVSESALGSDRAIGAPFGRKAPQWRPSNLPQWRLLEGKAEPQTVLQVEQNSQGQG